MADMREKFYFEERFRVFEGRKQRVRREQTRKREDGRQNTEQKGGERAESNPRLSGL
jgi:hypothetical protein